MIIVMRGDVTPASDAVREVVQLATRYEGVQTQVRTIEGATRSLTEAYLLGSTAAVPQEPVEGMAGGDRVTGVRGKYRSIGRHEGEAVEVGFVYNGVQFSQDTFHLMPGLCAVDRRKSV